SSKWALEGFSECLYLELKSFNIDVVLVEPGAYHTKIFSDNLRYARGFNDPASPYYGMSANVKKFVDVHLKHNKRNPEDVAACLQRLVETSYPRFRNIISFQSKSRCWGIRHIPFELYAWIVGRLLAREEPVHV
ncbi:MAG: hypothetical protein V2A70_06795, partial [Candidatus Omnitrophota bacterium]